MTDIEVISVTFPIPDGMVPRGTFWDAGGASFQAWMDDSERGWHWHPINTMARGQGKPDGGLVDHYPIVGGLPKRNAQP